MSAVLSHSDFVACGHVRSIINSGASDAPAVFARILDCTFVYAFTGTTSPHVHAIRVSNICQPVSLAIVINTALGLDALGL